MSRRDYLPDAEAPFAAWAANFQTLVAADPARYGLQPSDGAALSAAFGAFAALRAAALEPGTRTRVVVAEKNGARAALERLVRSLVRRVQSSPGTAAADRAALAIDPRDPHRAAIGPPAGRPVLTLAPPRRGGVPLLRLAHGASLQSVALPAGVMSAILFTCAAPAGAAPDPASDDWRFAAVATRGVVPLPTRRLPAGQCLYVAAAWTSPRGELGPRSVPFCATAA